MSDQERATGRNELGMVLCKVCNELIYTLPTDGIKKWYMNCGSEQCLDKSCEGEHE